MAGEGGGSSFSSFSVPTNLGSNFHSKVQLQASEICVVFRLTFIFPLLLCYLSACVHREISRLGGEAAALAPSSFSSLAANLCGLGKGSSVTAASAENRLGSVRERQTIYPTDGMGKGGWKEEAKSCCVMRAVELLNRVDKGLTKGLSEVLVRQMGDS